MANITRSNPFSLSGSSPFEDIFEGFFRPVGVAAEHQPQIKIDVDEDKNDYKVLAEIPGVKKENIHVSVDGNQVSISAESHQEKEVKEGTKVLRSERYYGKVSRSFFLEQEVDETAADAEYKDGILTLTLPKKVNASTKRLTVR
ncbi:MAG: heat-shock protein Hsp20 [Betaproteobacteria bacterium HGW-Betaproteobacteria-22]|nr:MAG: heat-shock protein Hsp20 [Betaproteobacteria bacterium HGW-Betaproteobacteria-22]